MGKPTPLRYTALQLAVHAAALTPLVWLLVDALMDDLTANPIQAATRRTGVSALSLLIASLSITPLQTLTGNYRLGKLRRPLGLYAFLYAAIHLSIFVGIDYGFAWNLIWLDASDKRFVWVGLAAFTILAALAFTSFDYWKKKLGKNWKRLHRLVYAASLLIILHFTWAVKGDLALLSGEVVRPVLFGLGVIFLLALRFTAVRKAVVRLRERVKRIDWRPIEPDFPDQPHKTNNEP